MASEIDLSVLRRKVNVLLNHVIDQLKIETLPIDQQEDFYWDFNDSEMFKTSEDPTIVAGRLTDDIEFLEKMDDEYAVSLMLSHIAPLLRYIALKIGQ